MRLGVGFRQLRTCRRIRRGQLLGHKRCPKAPVSMQPSGGIKFVLRTALGPNQIGFSHSLPPHALHGST